MFRHVILTGAPFSVSNTGSRFIFLPIGDGDSCSGVGGSKRFMISSKFLKTNTENRNLRPAYVDSLLRNDYLGGIVVSRSENPSEQELYY